MCDEDKDKKNFGLFVLIVALLLIINIIANIFTDCKVNEVMSSSTGTLSTEYAKKAVSILLISSGVSIFVEVISWFIPKSNLYKVYNEMESPIYKGLCIISGAIFHWYMIYNTVSPFLEARKLLIKSAESLFMLPF